MLGWPYCCCGVQACPLFSDDFERADSGTIGNGWTENSGTWNIVSGAIRTASANARCTNNEPAAFSTSNRIKGRVRSSASGDLVRLMLSTNSYIELKIGTGATLALVVNFSTVSTCSVTAAVDTWHTLQLDMCGSLLRGTQFSGTIAYLNGVPITFGTGVESLGSTIDIGFGTGGTVTGNCDFDDFEQLGLELYNEAQDVVLTGSPTGGTFTLTIPGYGTTTAINWNANAAAVKTALETVLTVTTFAPVVTTGGALPGNSVRCFLGGTAAGKNVGLMTVGTNSLTGGTSPNVSISAFRDGDTCAECRACHPLTDSNMNTGQIKIISAGWANGANGTGATDLNGTFFLDPVGEDCTDAPNATGSCSDGLTPYRSPCQCYEKDVSFTITHTTLPTIYNIVRLRAYSANFQGGSPGTAKTFAVEFVDDAGEVRVFSVDRGFFLKTCHSAGYHAANSLGGITQCFLAGAVNSAGATITAEAA